ncbi:hypothetical protein V2J09_021128 [Rumex salicifolius]
METEEQDVLRERDARITLPEEGVGMGAHEEEGEDEGAELVQESSIVASNDDEYLLELYEVIANIVRVTFDHVCDWSTGGGILILMLLDRCKELCRSREMNKNKTTQKVKLKYVSLVLGMDHVGDHAWGAVVLVLIYLHHGTTRSWYIPV